jgi:drug/metabolite transporter superfamily protein YnfA
MNEPENTKRPPKVRKLGDAIGGVLVVVGLVWAVRSVSLNDFSFTHPAAITCLIGLGVGSVCPLIDWYRS